MARSGFPAHTGVVAPDQGKPSPEEIRRAYSRLLAGRDASPRLSDLVRELQGVYPSAVAAALRELRLPYTTERDTAAVRNHYTVELHALDYEWYFQPETIAFLASQLPDSADVLFIGTPTVAAARARAGKYLRLIDSNPLVTRRFPDLAFPCTHIGRIQQVRRTYDEPDYILLDAPWNFSDVVTWMRFAHAHARPGTQILATLFPAATRPTAERERARIVALAQQIGATKVWTDAIKYETPLFEQEALRAEGIDGIGEWRSGDLLIIRVERRETAWDRIVRTVSANRGAPRERWTRFVLGSQVVKLRATATHQSHLVLKPVASCPHGVLPSVSARDPRRRSVGIWTSRNRVASVAEPARVARVLRSLEQGSTFPEALDAAAGQGGPIDEPSARILHGLLALANS